MAYDRSYWKDHVTDQSGEVIQQGTLLDQQHFNNMELGISDMTLAGAIMQFKAVQDGYKHKLKIHYYIRYMDDVIILGPDKETLHRWKAAVETFLREELALDLNSKTSIRPVRQGVEFVGVRIWPTHMKLRKSTVRRIKREVRKISALYAAGDMTQQDFYRRVASIRGLLKHTESASLRWRLNEIYRAELEKGEQKRLREEAQHEPFADHSGAGNGDGNAGTGYQDHGNPACRAG